MAEADVELVKRTYAVIQEAYRTGDTEELRRFTDEWCDPEYVLRTSGGFPETGEWHGADGVVQFVSGQMEAFSEMWIEMDGVIDGGDVTVAWHRFGGQARHTGIDVEFSAAFALWTRDGRSLRTQIFPSKSEALEAAGLSE